MANPRVFFDMAIGGHPVCRIMREVFADAIERGVTNTLSLINRTGIVIGGELMANGGPDQMARQQAASVNFWQNHVANDVDYWQDLEAGGDGQLLSTRIHSVDPRFRADSGLGNRSLFETREPSEN